MSTFAFSTVTALTEKEPGRFAGELNPEWTIGGKPNGGYLLAMLGRAAVATGGQPHVLTASATYLRPPEPGPVEIAVEPLRSGRSADQLRASMTQDGRRCVEALITTSRLSSDTAPFWDAGVPAPGTDALDDCVRVPGTGPSGVRVAIMDQAEVRLEPATTGFAVGRPSGSGELRGWLSLPDGEPFDPLSLLYAVDAFPPATFEISPTGWVPTLELTAYVRAMPAPGPVRVLMRAQLVGDQKVDEACWVWDRTGRLVAQATQLAGIRLG